MRSLDVTGLISHATYPTDPLLLPHQSRHLSEPLSIVPSSSFIASIAGFDRLPIAGMVIQMDGGVIAVNAAAERIVGPDLVGRKLWSVMPALETMWPTVMPAVVLRGEHAFEIAAGSKQVQLVLALREHDGQRVMLGFATDLSDRTQGARTSHRLESLGLVAGGIAHEVNNQLVAVIAEAGGAREAHARSDEA